MKSIDVYLCREPNLFPALNNFIGKHFYHADEKFTEASLLANKIGYCIFCVVNKTTKTVLRFIYKKIGHPEVAAKNLYLDVGEQAVSIRIQK